MRPSIARSVSCALWGHHVDNHVFERAASAGRQCRCGASYLHEDGSLTHVRHTLSCFLGHHTYRRLTDRHHCHEYVCVQCGHPLLFRADNDPYSAEHQFRKKVRYLCGLFGHRATAAASRDGFVEYACHCGHTFLKDNDALSTIRHPLACTLRGHWIHFVARRSGFTEYVCRTCGHPFCFADPKAVPNDRELPMARAG
jgi:DNA-directed RNA polymerase subunit RPC12/RpoP